MCQLNLGTLSGSDLELVIDCGYMHVVVAWAESIARQSSWPTTHVARLEFWEKEPPLILRMDNVYSIHPVECPNYVTYKRNRSAEEAAAEDPSTNKKK